LCLYSFFGVFVYTQFNKAMSCSDYIAVKRRLATVGLPIHTSSERTENRVFLTLQTTHLMDGDGEPVQIPERHRILLPERDLAYIIPPPKPAPPVIWNLGYK